MLVVTVDPKIERLEINLPDGQKVVVMVEHKVRVGVIAPKDIGIKRVKHDANPVNSI